MRIILFFLFIALFQVYAIDSYSQESTISVTATNMKLGQFFKTIEKQSNFMFFYVDSDIEGIDVNVNVKEASVTAALNQALSKTGLAYEIHGQYITILPAQLVGKAQGATITGTVTDEAGEPMPGVNVMIKGTIIGQVTDANGRFSINVPNKDAVLLFSFIGYTTQEMVVGDRTRLDITMAEDTKEIGEVVVVGYGAQRKEVVTGAITSMKSSDVALSPSGNVAAGLAGRLSGVIINTRTGEAGDEGTTVLVRGLNSFAGSNDPLYVIDGIVRSEDGGILSRLDPEDIESITVLKDASAAIYGSRAANGVILITTKRGKEGKKPTINLSYNHSFQQPTRIVKMANSSSYARAQNLANEIRGLVPRWTDEEIQKFADGSDPEHYPNTNWYKEIQKTWSHQDKANLQLSGGSDRLIYLVSAGLLNQGTPYNDGAMNNRMYNIRSNIDAKINEHIKITFDLYGKNGNRVATMFGPASGGVYGWIGLSAPTVHAYWPGTKYATNRGWGNLNPLPIISGEAGTINTASWVFNGQSAVDISLPWVKGLSVKGSFAYDYFGQNLKDFNDVYYVYDYNESANTYQKIKGLTGTPQLAITEKRIENVTCNIRLNYLNTFANVHTVDAFVGFEQNESKSTMLNGSRKNFPTGALVELNAGDANSQENQSTTEETARLNYFGRLLYDYDHRYMLQLQFRYDGSQNFPEGKRFGFFPGVSAGWTITRESFMQNVTWLNNLKVRGSWGKMGNDAVAAYQYMTMYTLNDADKNPYGAVFNGAFYQGISQANTPNPNITWETAETYDIGLETGFFSNRLTLEFDWFKTRRTDILAKRQASVPNFTGLSLPDENIGITENKGVEFMLGFRDNPSTDFSYSVSGNFTYAHNKIVYMDETPMAEDYQKQEGKPIGSPLKYKSIGVYTDADVDIDSKVPRRAGTVAGDIKIWDANGDGEINSLDRIRQDVTPIPDIIYGLNIYLKWKQFDLTLAFQGQARAILYLRDDWVNPATSGGGANILQWWTEDTYTSDNPNGTKPRLGTAYGIGGTTLTQINASFFKLKNAEIGYNIPRNISAKVGLENARVYINGTNLFSFDKLRKFGIDPEVLNGGWDLNPMRLINLGVNISF